MPPDGHLLCSTCASLLDPLNPAERCPLCFHPKRSEFLTCSDCLKYPTSYTAISAVFESQGPALSLLNHFKHRNSPYLAHGIAAFMVAQFMRLEWPLPDAIVPVPLSLVQWIRRGYDQSLLLAVEVGKLLEKPVWKVLKQSSCDDYETSVSFEKRLGVNLHGLKVSSAHSLEGKTLLVVDDLSITGPTLRACGEVLQRERPAAIYALTFCLRSEEMQPLRGSNYD